MPVKQFKVGGDRNFGYLAWDEETRESFIVDPAYSPKMIIDYAHESGLLIKYIFNTHAHFDHTNGNAEAAQITGVSAVGFDDYEHLTDQDISDGSILPLGKKKIKIIYTPGHTDDSICILFEDSLFTGDTLFVGKVGGTGFGTDARLEYDSLHQKLMTLPNDTKIYPGHDYGVAPESTIAHEKGTNPFLLRPDFESFVDLKKNWAEYKKEHGIA